MTRPTPHADRLAAMSDAELIEDAVLTAGAHCARCCPVCRAKPWHEQSTAEKFLTACTYAAVGWGIWRTLRPNRVRSA